MRVFKEKEDLSVVNITNIYRTKNILAGLFLVSLVVVIFSSFTPIKQNIIYQDVIIHDTIQQLVVLKHGMSEITVDRNANIPTFCNNPGALRPTHLKEVNDLAIGTVQAPSGEFLYFANSEHGFKALEIVLKKVYWNNTISQCISRYAPSFENNTDGYVNKIVSKLGCSHNTLVKNCNLKKLMLVISEIEGYEEK